MQRRNDVRHRRIIVWIAVVIAVEAYHRLLYLFFVAKPKIDAHIVQFGVPTIHERGFEFCMQTTRCKSLNQDRRFSFVHISKAAGTSWIQELQKTKVELYPEQDHGEEYSVAYQNAQHTFDYLSYHMVSLRSPRHHVWSLWAECRFDDWGQKTTNGTTFPRAGESYEGDVVDFTSWINHFVDPVSHRVRDERDFYSCYHPSNYQARALASDMEKPHGPGPTDAIVPDATTAYNTYWYLDWVAIREFYHESKCLLFYRMEPKSEAMKLYLDETCHCQPTTKQDETNETKHNDVQVLHHDGRRRKTMRNLDDSLLMSIDALTVVDVPLYTTALKQFMEEIAWMEANIGHRVMCEGTLKKWETELEYLSLSPTSLYDNTARQSFW